MKYPKRKNRHCPYCNEHTLHRVKEASSRGRNKANPMSRHSKRRVRMRGSNRGAGNQGRYSRPPIGAWQLVGKKTSDKTDLRFTCDECGKAHVQKRSVRTRRLQLV